MALVTAINLSIGGTSDEVVVEDQNGNALPVANITWGAPPEGVTISLDTDGVGFDFLAGASAVAGSFAVAATYSGPGNPAPVVGSLTVNVMAAPPTITSLEFDEKRGS